MFYHCPISAHHCLVIKHRHNGVILSLFVLRWPCTVDRTLKSSWQLTTMYFFRAEVRRGERLKIRIWSCQCLLSCKCLVDAYLLTSKFTQALWASFVPQITFTSPFTDISAICKWSWHSGIPSPGPGFRTEWRTAERQPLCRPPRYSHTGFEWAERGVKSHQPQTRCRPGTRQDCTWISW